MKPIFGLSFVRRLRVVGFLFLIAAPVCRADLVAFTSNPNYAVVVDSNGTLAYDASTGNFQSDSTPLSYTSPFTVSNDGGGVAFFTGDGSTNDISVNLLVNPDGSFKGGGTGITITGSIDIDGDGIDDVVTSGPNTPLLTGDIYAFGAQAAGPPVIEFDGLFTITGGLLTQNVFLSGGGSTFGGFPLGATGGFILNAENVTSGTLGDFTQDFSSDAVKATADVATVPEPATSSFLLAGVALLWMMRHRTRRGPGAGASALRPRP
jgi:hypothetical protein